MDPIQVKKYMCQLIKATEFIHSHNIIHRDIKPENLLISTHGALKICDFGFARFMGGADSLYTDYVSTRWYRAPELLVGDTNYGTPVDVWAIGCLFPEIYNGQPLFPGNSDLHTLSCILDALGNNITLKQKQAFFDNPIFVEMKLPNVTNISQFRAKIPEMEEVAIDFLEKCLDMDPERRWDCQQLLRHPYFDGFMETFQTEFIEILCKDAQEMKSLSQAASPNVHKTSKELEFRNIKEAENIGLSPRGGANTSYLFGEIEPIEEMSDSLDQTLGSELPIFDLQDDQKGENMENIQSLHQELFRDIISPHFRELGATDDRLSSHREAHVHLSSLPSATFNPPVKEIDMDQGLDGDQIMQNKWKFRSEIQEMKSPKQDLQNNRSSSVMEKYDNIVSHNSFVNPFLNPNKQLGSVTTTNLKGILNKVNITFSNPVFEQIEHKTIPNMGLTSGNFGNNLNNSFTGKKIMTSKISQSKKEKKITSLYTKENADFKNAPSFLSNIFVDAKENTELSESKSGQFFPSVKRVRNKAPTNIGNLPKASRLIALPNISEGRPNEKFYMKRGTMLRINETYLHDAYNNPHTPILKHGNSISKNANLNETFDESKKFFTTGSNSFQSQSKERKGSLLPSIGYGYGQPFHYKKDGNPQPNVKIIDLQHNLMPFERSNIILGDNELRIDTNSLKSQLSMKKKKGSQLGVLNKSSRSTNPKPKTPNPPVYESGLKIHSTFLLLETNQKIGKQNILPSANYGD